jgi:ornithine cyclodeaminase/alanine dehydrogenase
MLILSETDLRSVLTMREVIDAVERGFGALGSGDAFAPERLQLPVPDREAVLLEMPASLRAASPGDSGVERSGGLGTKIVAFFPQNSRLALDVVQAVYILFDPKTGIPLALMEGRFITAIRTAATSAVATRHMATAGPKHLAVFGAGVQARFHLEAMIAVATIERVTIVERAPAKAHELAEHVRRRHSISCQVSPADDAASQADLICTCTTSLLPLFDGGLIKPGTHVNAVGAFNPTSRELDTETVRRSRVIVDAESAAGREAGEILIPIAEGAIGSAHVRGTLAEVVSGRVAGRESDREITLFKSCGLAIEDLVTAQLAYDRAFSSGIGTRVEL